MVIFHSVVKLPEGTVAASIWIHVSPTMLWDGIHARWLPSSTFIHEDSLLKSDATLKNACMTMAAESSSIQKGRFSSWGIKDLFDRIIFPDSPLHYLCNVI